jgi:hypothetical protein
MIVDSGVNDCSVISQLCLAVTLPVSLSRVESSVMTDGQSASVSWKSTHLGLTIRFYYCQTVAGLLIWGGLSDDRMGLLFKIVAGPRQRSHS